MMMSSKSTNKGPEVRVVTYNILSSSLASPGYFTHCEPKNLSTEKRYSRIMKKLDGEIDAGSVVCLQEISLLWAGRLEALFHKKGYHFIQTQYGTYHSDFMGVGIGFPMSKYSMEDCVMMRLTDLVSWKREPRPVARTGAIQWLVKLPVQVLSGVMASLSRTLPMLGSRKRNDWLTIAKYKQNRIVALKLKCLSTKKSFLMGTYHMPCMPGKPKVLLTHAALAAQFMETHAGKDPYLLAGDWNILPGSDPYNHLVEGESELSLDLPSWETWTPKLKNKLKSAYKEFLGSEPEFTNNAKVRDDPAFVDTLDYIFMSEDWVVETVRSLPKKESIEGPYPNAEEPSDHIMIQATLKQVP